MQLEITERVKIEKVARYCVLVTKGHVCLKTSQAGSHKTFSCVFESEDVCSLIVPVTQSFLVGEINGDAVSLVNIDISSDLPLGYSWASMRELYDILPHEHIGVASRAVQLQSWLREHRFCGVCGSKTTSSNDDRAMVCCFCAHRMYPRISPCVIGVIRKGDQLLLAQGVKHKEGTYSALAGFIEPGESAEEAFRREVFEEVGIKITHLRYLFSQPWPFPGQLMLGFVAEYESGDIKVAEKEIVRAAWFTKFDLPLLPPSYTISGKIIEHVIQGLK